MNRIIKKLNLVLAAFMALFAVSAFMAPAAIAATPATPQSQICAGVGAVTGSTDCSTGSGEKSVNDILRLVLQILSFVVGVIAVIMLIIGGLKYILSQGESGQTASAKNTILYAIIGMVVVALAQTIVKFVLNKTK